MKQVPDRSACAPASRHTILFAGLLQRVFGAGLQATRPGSRWIPALFGVVVFAYGGIPFLRGGIDDADAVRPESAEAVRRLHAEGIEVVMLTGDSRSVAEAVARQLGIDTVFAQVLPRK